MGKKKSAKAATLPARQPRKEKYSGDRLDQIVERLRDQAARIAGLAKAMQDSRVKEILVDGHAMLMRGLNQIDNFADNSSRAVREAKSALLGR